MFVTPLHGDNSVYVRAALTLEEVSLYASSKGTRFELD